MAQVFAGKSGSNIRWQLAQILVDIYTADRFIGSNADRQDNEIQYIMGQR